MSEAFRRLCEINNEIRRLEAAEALRVAASLRMKRVKTFARVFALAAQKRCVWHSGWRHHIPASVAAHWPAQMLYNLIAGGWLFVYPRRKGAR